MNTEPKPATGGDAWTEKTVKEMCQFTASDFKLIADAHNAAIAAAVAYERQLRPAWDKINQLKDEIKELKGNKMTEGDCQIVIGALDSLGVALTDKKHQWTEGERAIYEKAIEIALGIGRRVPPTQAFTVEINGEDVLFVRLDAHNAALAAEREQCATAVKRAAEQLAENHKQQLAAEREKAEALLRDIEDSIDYLDGNKSALELCDGELSRKLTEAVAAKFGHAPDEIQQLREQLAAARKLQQLTEDNQVRWMRNCEKLERQLAGKGLMAEDGKVCAQEKGEGAGPEQDAADFV
jgi:hypothetical protein